MSNADDRCARDGCGWPRKHHNPFGKYPCNAFVEPAPQPAPSGDEAKVREMPDGIADRWLHLHTMMPPAFSDVCQRPGCGHARHLHAPSCGHVTHDGVKNCACMGFVGSAMSVADALLGAVRDAYAAGKADEREACKEACIGNTSAGGCMDAIARRGSEGK